jgi:hypothetical protein
MKCPRLIAGGTSRPRASAPTAIISESPSPACMIRKSVTLRTLASSRHRRPPDSIRKATARHRPGNQARLRTGWRRQRASSTSSRWLSICERRVTSRIARQPSGDGANRSDHAARLNNTTTGRQPTRKRSSSTP